MALESFDVALGRDGEWHLTWADFWAERLHYGYSSQGTWVRETLDYSSSYCTVSQNLGQNGHRI
jgi:hypothetical protein